MQFKLTSSSDSIINVRKTEQNLEFPGFANRPINGAVSETRFSRYKRRIIRNRP